MGFSFRPGIRTEIVFTLTVLMAGSVALVGMLFLKVEERNLLEERVRAGKQITAALERFIQEEKPASPPALNGQNAPANLQRVVDLFAQTRGPFSRFCVVDRQFRILADSSPGQVGKFYRDSDLGKAMDTGKVLVRGSIEDQSVSLINKNALLVSAPLTVHEKAMGGIRAELPLDDLREILFRSQATVFMYVFLTALLLIVMGSFLLSRVIINPLKKLVQMSEKIAEGDLNSMDAASGSDEVGKVFSSFNHMAGRLKEDRAKMKEYIQSLEKVNRELRQAQDEVVRSEKLASIGRLAAGVAHEVGNPTGAILGYLDLVLKGGFSEEEKTEILRRAESEAERIRRIIRELLDFSRPSPRVEDEVEVNAVIDRALSLLSHQKKIWEQMDVVKEYENDLPAWRGDPHQLQQVMVNLFMNAADAMASSDPSVSGREKKLRVATRSVSVEEFPAAAESLSRRRKEDSPGSGLLLIAGPGGKRGTFRPGYSLVHSD